MSEDKTVRLWDTEKGTALNTFDKLPEAISVAAAAEFKCVWADNNSVWFALSASTVLLNVESGDFSSHEYSIGPASISALSLSQMKTNF